MEAALQHLTLVLPRSSVAFRPPVGQRVIWRVIWPLIILLAAPIFGLLYKALTTG